MLRTVRGDGDVRVDELIRTPRPECPRRCRRRFPRPRSAAPVALRGTISTAIRSSEEEISTPIAIPKSTIERDVHPHGISSVEEQRQGHGVQYAEQQGGNLSVTLEQLVREPPGDTVPRSFSSALSRLRKSPLHPRIPWPPGGTTLPSVYGISGYVMNALAAASTHTAGVRSTCF